MNRKLVAESINEFRKDPEQLDEGLFDSKETKFMKLMKDSGPEKLSDEEVNKWFEKFFNPKSSGMTGTGGVQKVYDAAVKHLDRKGKLGLLTKAMVIKDKFYTIGYDPKEKVFTVRKVEVESGWTPKGT